MIKNKKIFYSGLGLLVSFFIVLVLMFSPIFKGQNGLEYLDDLYNSISKGSAYFIPKLQEDIEPLKGEIVSFTIKMDSVEQASQTAILINKNGANVEVSGSMVKVKGDLGKILDNCLKDADLMYFNQGTKIVEKYGYYEKQVLYNWWVASSRMDKALKKQKLFKEAKVVSIVQKKGLETSYNYYKIESQKISAKWGIVLFSLVFYVVYTLWYGFAIMFLFEGWGLQFDH
ncbi:MAG: hypothetical protein GY710_13335 [Desulfobacteraceae bacterium]|nr:hypothetical protein [Desulfobacteraceae bacterium]